MQLLGEKRSRKLVAHDTIENESPGYAYSYFTLVDGHQKISNFPCPDVIDFHLALEKAGIESPVQNLKSNRLTVYTAAASIGVFEKLDSACIQVWEPLHERQVPLQVERTKCGLRVGQRVRQDGGSAAV